MKNTGDNIYTAPEQPLNPPDLPDDVTQDQVDLVLRQYSNADYAQALIENDPVNEFARTILVGILDFADSMISSGINIISNGKTNLDLMTITRMAIKSAEIQAYEQIEKENLK